jgi:hypothetical protein
LVYTTKRINAHELLIGELAVVGAAVGDTVVTIGADDIGADVSVKDSPEA